MNPYYKDEYVTIYHGDCREILPELPKVDLVLTDPPYNVAYENLDWDKFTTQEYLEFSKDWIAKTYNILSDNGTFYWFSAFQFRYLLETICINSGYSMLSEIVWPHRGAGRCKNKISHKHEIIKVFVKDKNNWIFNADDERIPYLSLDRYKSGVTKNGKTYFPNPEGKIVDSVWDDIAPIFKDHPENNDHPTQKPTKLFSRMINLSSNADDLILDPFLGSGTTCYCAKKLGRKSIGIEISEKYCEIAAKRCMQTVMNFEQPKVEIKQGVMELMS